MRPSSIRFGTTLNKIRISFYREPFTYDSLTSDVKFGRMESVSARPAPEGADSSCISFCSAQPHINLQYAGTGAEHEHASL